MDSNPIHHPSPAKKMKCSFLDYVQFLMISQAGWWTQTPSATPLQPIKWNASFWIMFTSDDQPGWLMDSNPICHLFPAKKWNAHFWITFTLDDQPGWSMDSNPIHHPSPPKKNEMLIFGLCSTSDDQLGWSMDSNHICHPSPTKKMKCSFFKYIQHLMISQAGRWTQTPSTTPLLPKKWNAHFWIMSNFWCWPDWSMDSNPIHHPCAVKKMKCFFFGLRSTSDDWLGWVMDSNPIHHPSPAKKMKCSFLDYIQLLMIGRAGRWTQTPSTTRLQPKEWNPHFCITLNFWWSAGLVNGLEPHLPPLSSQNYEMLIFGFCSTSDDQPGWSMDSNPICQPSAPKKMKCSFLDYVQLLMISQVCRWTWTPSTTCLQPKNEMLIFGLCSTSDDQPGC